MPEKSLDNPYQDVIGSLRARYPGGHPDFIPLTIDEVALHAEKNSDYARNGDPLGNFMRVARILAQYPGLSVSDPVVVALVYAMKQLDAALWMLAKGYEGSVENIDTRLRDVHVYMKLARILAARAKESKPSEAPVPGAKYLVHRGGRLVDLAEPSQLSATCQTDPRDLRCRCV